MFRPIPPRFFALVLFFASASGASELDRKAIFHASAKPLPPGAVVTDWPCFLGPAHNQTSPETHLLKKFPPAGPMCVWEMARGEGYSAPAVQGDQLVCFHRVGDEEVVDCLRAATGERLWQHHYPTSYQDRYGYCNGPRASPVIADGAVFTIGAEGKLYCLDLASGAVRWELDLAARFKLKPNFFGVGSTPLVMGNLLIVNVGAPGGPCVAAFNVRTGKLAWGAGDQWGPSYASPIPAKLHGKDRVLVFAGGESRPPTGGLLCLDPLNGKIDFTFPWRGTRRESVNASSPLVVDDKVFVSECYGSGGAMLEVAPDFGVKPLWTSLDFGTHFMTAVAQDGYLYGVDGHGPDDAFLFCTNLETGKQSWRTQPEWEETVNGVEGARKIPTGTYRCWLNPADGRWLVLGEFGHLLWAELSPKGYRELSRAWLFAAGETWTPPVLSRGLLYVCQNSRDTLHGTGPRILCYDLRE